MTLTLTISHNVFLTKEERYKLFAGETLDLVGISVPIWYYDGQTSEPGNEVFCKYTLTPSDDKIYVNYKKDGYEIFLPRTAYSPEDDKKNPITLKNILDVPDGGIAWIAFRQFGKIKKNRKDINMVHFVEIKRIEELEATMN
jgi:hypothetical protein